jgi:hypothetical protein
MKARVNLSVRSLSGLMLLFMQYSCDVEQEVAYVRDIPDKITVEGVETITNLNDYKGFNAEF